MAKENIDPVTGARLNGLDCACLNLRMTARAVTQLYDEALRPTGLKSTQFALLMAIRILGEVPMSRLADFLVMDRTTLTRNLRPLEKRGWIGIETGNDRRVRKVSLTGAGVEMLRLAVPYWESVQTRLAERLGPGRLTRLISGLQSTVQEIRVS